MHVLPANTPNGPSASSELTGPGLIAEGLRLEEEIGNTTAQTILIALEVMHRLSGEGSGHDWWHIECVWKTARLLAKAENVALENLVVIDLAALLHDVADWKAHNGDEEIGPRTAREIMSKFGIDANVIEHVCDIIARLSFKGANVAAPRMTSLEGEIVQDADRLQAIGAIGIARTFAYGGSKGREIYNPRVKPEMHQSKEAYFNGKGHTINHFHEKLLLLKDRMNTPTAKRIAVVRHARLKQYLEWFHEEWDGEKETE